MTQKTYLTLLFYTFTSLSLKYIFFCFAIFLMCFTFQNHPISCTNIYGLAIIIISYNINPILHVITVLFVLSNYVCLFGQQGTIHLQHQVYSRTYFVVTPFENGH